MRCVDPCNNDSGRTSAQDISYFEFPAEPILRAAWLAAGWRPRPGGAVCSRHFLRQDLLQSGGRLTLCPGAVPVAGVLVCRICFAADIKLYSMAQYKSLYTAYETVTGLTVYSEEYLPQFLCADCARRLLACARFRARSLQAHSVLLDVAAKHRWMTVENIIEHQSLLSPNLTDTQSDQCDFDLELLKTEKIHTDEQGKELSLETENDDVKYKLLLKCETSDDVEMYYGGVDTMNDNLPLREEEQQAELSDNGTIEGVEASHADVVPITVNLKHFSDGHTSQENMEKQQRKKKKRKKYTVANLASALKSIEQGTTIYQASRTFNIPATTLRNKRDGIYCNDNCGVQPVLYVHEEKHVVDWIQYLGKCGFSVTKEQLLDNVAELVKALKRPNRFKDGRPGKTWFLSFLKRHPTMAKHVTQNLPTCRNQITEGSLREWFDRIYAYFENNDLLQVFDDPRRVFNCDEIAFFLTPKEKQVLVKRGSKRVYNRVANDDKECLTVLVNVSANGDIAPPMVLYPYTSEKEIPRKIKLSVPGWWGFGNTESGWMTMESFYEYIANVFYPWLLENEVTLPVALFLEGHTSHISLPLTTFCKEKGIVLIALLPNATHVLQPLDVAVFRPVKGTWRDIVHEYRVNNDHRQLKRTDFAKEVQKCFDRCLKPETIKNGFKCCGIVPFDPKNIDYEKLLSKVKKPHDEQSTI